MEEKDGEEEWKGMEDKYVSQNLIRNMSKYQNLMKYFIRMFDLDFQQIQSIMDVEGECFYLIEKETVRLSED